MARTMLCTHGYCNISCLFDSNSAGNQAYRFPLGATWKLGQAKKNIVACFSAATKHRAMTETTCELLWVKNFLVELGLFPTSPCLYTDNTMTIFIANNPIFDKRTKHIRVDYHLVPRLFVLPTQSMRTMF